VHETILSSPSSGTLQSQIIGKPKMLPILEDIKTKGINRIAKIGQGHI